jgi:ABC-2 type transport system permease protein
MKSFVSFVKKEFHHIFRDVRTMLILLIIPLILIILFGYAISTEIKSSPIAILDYSRDNLTNRLAEQLQASEYFELYKMAASYEEVQTLFRQDKIRLAILFPPRLQGAGQPAIQILADATNPNEATALIQYATAIISASGAAVRNPPEAVSQTGVIPSIRLLYNPQMKGAYNFVPGVMGLLLMLICAMMTSVGIVKEKETGSMEVLLVSPLKPACIILAKATPSLFLSMVNIATILLLSRFLLGVPIAGNLVLLFSISILYALVSLCLGLFISTIANTQQAAMLLSGMVLMLPAMLLSGMIFPVENMPWILRVVSNIVPAKWYIIAVKNVMIKGLGIAFIWKETAIMLLMILFLLAVSIKRFKIRLQ